MIHFLKWVLIFKENHLFGLNFGFSLCWKMTLKSTTVANCSNWNWNPFVSSKEQVITFKTYYITYAKGLATAANLILIWILVMELYG